MQHAYRHDDPSAARNRPADGRRRRGPTFRQLYREAQRRKIEGRSRMSKEELQRALTNA